jgi:hypothetical protein
MEWWRTEVLDHLQSWRDPMKSPAPPNSVAACCSCVCRGCVRRRRRRAQERALHGHGEMLIVMPYGRFLPRMAMN